MLKLNQSAPEHVVAIKTIGQITSEDCKSVLIPAIEKQIKASGKVRLVYENGGEL